MCGCVGGLVGVWVSWWVFGVGGREKCRTNATLE